MLRLYGREVLIVEDHPLMLVEIADALRKVGAKPMTAGTLEQALTALEHDSFAAAILDHLPDGGSAMLCKKLEERDIPVVIYSGRETFNGHCLNATVVDKTASTEELIAAVENLLPAEMA
jgi:DNA-binding response OmpR family regulator